MKKENKLLAILSYLGILFLVPYIYNKNSDFVKHHAKTGKNLFLIKTRRIIHVNLIKSNLGNLELIKQNLYVKTSN